MPAPSTTVLTRSAARLLLIPALLIALATMIKGYGDTGDGFSAGVIATLAIAIQGVAFGPTEFDRLPLVRFAAVGAFIGLLIAIAVAFVPVFFGDPIMTHWPPKGDHAVHFGTLEFITPVLFDVSVFLVVFGFGVGSLTVIARALRRLERAQARAMSARAQALQRTGQRTGHDPAAGEENG